MSQRLHQRPCRADAGLIWKLLTFLVENQGNEVISDHVDLERDAEKIRTTWYLDTPGYERLEMFPPTVVVGANRLFRDVQNQAGWLAQFGSTKTAYAFDVL